MYCHSSIPRLVPSFSHFFRLFSLASLINVEWYTLKSFGDVAHPSLSPLFGVQLVLFVSFPRNLYSVCSCSPSSALLIFPFIPNFVRILHSIGLLTLGHAFVMSRSVATGSSGCFTLGSTVPCAFSWILMNT